MDERSDPHSPDGSELHLEEDVEASAHGPRGAQTSSGRSAWRARLIRILASLFGVLFALLIGELAVRVFAPQVTFPRYVTDGGFGIRVNAPNARYWHSSPEMRVQFRINSMGIRSDREYTFEKPRGVIRIIGLGDSFTQGYEVDVDETYLFRLERLLRDRGYPVETINLGVSGHGNAEELVMLTQFGLKFDPDVVIVGYYQNDPEDNVRSNLFRFDESGALVRAASRYLPAVGMRDYLYRWATYRWLSEHSQLFSLAREQASDLVKRHLYRENVEETSPSDRGDYPLRLTARLLDRIEEECDAHGVEMILLDIPNWLQYGSNLPLDALQNIPLFRVVRPAARFRQHGPDAYLYRRRGHLHWTPRGHEIAAELLADTVSAVLQGEPLGD